MFSFFWKRGKHCVSDSNAWTYYCCAVEPWPCVPMRHRPSPYLFKEASTFFPSLLIFGLYWRDPLCSKLIPLKANTFLDFFVSFFPTSWQVFSRRQCSDKFNPPTLMTGVRKCTVLKANQPGTLISSAENWDAWKVTCRKTVMEVEEEMDKLSNAKRKKKER